MSLYNAQKNDINTDINIDINIDISSEKFPLKLPNEANITIHHYAQWSRIKINVTRDIIFPETLEKLIFVGNIECNEPISNLPKSLTSLNFIDGSWGEVKCPENLEEIWLFNSEPKLINIPHGCNLYINGIKKD